MAIVTMKQVIAFRNGVGTFMDKTLPLQAAYKLNKIRRDVNKEVEAYQEQFNEIVNTYAQVDENGNFKFSEDGSQILIKDGMIEECNQKLNELQNVETEISTNNLKIEDFGAIDCTPAELDAIMPFLN